MPSTRGEGKPAENLGRRRRLHQVSFRRPLYKRPGATPIPSRRQHPYSVRSWRSPRQHSHIPLVFGRSVDAGIFVFWSLRCCYFGCSSDLLALLFYLLRGWFWRFFLMHMRSRKYMGNLHLSLPWCNNLFSPWRSDASLGPRFFSFIPLLGRVLPAAPFDWFLVLLELSKRRWGDDGIVSLLVWLAAMMAKSVLALSDHLPGCPVLVFYSSYVSLYAVWGRQRSRFVCIFDVTNRAVCVSVLFAGRIMS
jgi:hypothetical protein